ncbi:MAG: nucleoside-diphosphate sugar epimerase/dehydratase [Bacteroidota bacterium]
MYRFLYNYFSKRFLSKWVVLVFDILAVTPIFYIAYLIRFGFDIYEVDKHINIIQIAFITALYILFYVIFRPYSGIIRHSGIKDAIKIINASVLAGIFTFGISLFLIKFELYNSDIIIPKGVIIIHSLLVLLALIGSRLFVRKIFQLANKTSGEVVRVAVYGAGSAGVITKDTLLRDKKIKYKITCFIDDNKTLNGKYMDGVQVIKPEKAFSDEMLEKSNITEVVIAIENLNNSRKNEIVDICLNKNLKVRTIPSVKKWVNGELSPNQIQEVNIEDLLERQTIVVNNNFTDEELQNKVVLVTGAAGSIGSEIVRQLISKKTKKVLLFEQSESPLHDFRIELGTDLAKKYPEVELEFVIGDIRNKNFVQKIFDLHKPEIVFHAAAYKHVPLMEEYPQQAISANVEGTKNVADASVKTGVGKFVMVSTDKAVNPTNVMGASKRIAEIYIQALNKKQSKTKFITTRFGNVLGSNGSVIPMFKKQIKSGGPITVTHKDITRYFMTIPEACQLVLEAGAMGKGGEIFIFDMGKSVKIFDVAKKMIKLSGYNYPDDIDIVFSGLRPGEKLYEELLASKENTISTYHPKIMVAKIREVNYTAVNDEINDLLLTVDEGGYEIVKKMKHIVPEFISNNSKYEELDKELVNSVL